MPPRGRGVPRAAQSRRSERQQEPEPRVLGGVSAARRVARHGHARGSDDADSRRSDAETAERGGRVRVRDQEVIDGLEQLAARRAEVRRRTADEDHREAPPARALEDRPAEIVRPREEEERVGTQPSDGPADAPVASARGRQDRVFRKLVAEPASRGRVARREEQPVARVTDRSASRSARSSAESAGPAPWIQMCGVPGRRHRAPAVERLTGRPGHTVDREPVEAIEVPERTVLLEAGRAGQVSVERSHARAHRPAVGLAGRPEERHAWAAEGGREVGGPGVVADEQAGAGEDPDEGAEVGPPGEVDDGAAGVACSRTAAPRARSPAEPSRTAGLSQVAGEPPAQRAEVARRPALGAPVRRPWRHGDERPAGQPRAPQQPTCSLQHFVARLDPGGGTVVSSEDARNLVGERSGERRQGGGHRRARRLGRAPSSTRSCAPGGVLGEAGRDRSGACPVRRARSRRASESVREPSGSQRRAHWGRGRRDRSGVA